VVICLVLLIYGCRFVGDNSSSDIDMC